MDAPDSPSPEAQHLPDNASSEPNELLLPPRPESPSLSSDLDEALLLVPEHPRPPRKPVLSPTLISDTLNCELEVLFVHTLRKGRRTRTLEMRAGTEVHAVLEREANGHVVEIPVQTAEEKTAVQLLNTISLLDEMLEGRLDVIREIPLFGKLEGQLVRGITDQIERRANISTENGAPPFIYVISDTKTTGSLVPTVLEKKGKGANALQLMIYKTLWDQLVTGHTYLSVALELFKASGLDPRKELGEIIATHVALVGLDAFGANNAVTLESLVPRLLERFRLFPKADDTLELHFHIRESGGVPTSTPAAQIHIVPMEYSPTFLQSNLRSALDFWTAKREPRGVEIAEAWRCRRCEFAETCVWRAERAGELGNNW